MKNIKLVGLLTLLTVIIYSCKVEYTYMGFITEIEYDNDSLGNKINIDSTAYDYFWKTKRPMRDIEYYVQKTDSTNCECLIEGNTYWLKYKNDTLIYVPWEKRKNKNITY